VEKKGRVVARRTTLKKSNRQRTKETRKQKRHTGKGEMKTIGTAGTIQSKTQSSGNREKVRCGN